jgi:hypothetical protein
LKHILASLACGVVLASAAEAQLSNYLGPGILTGGADTIGTRAGEQVDLRFYADVSAVYDNGVQPVSVDSKGNLVQVNGLYGITADIGAYGTHSWRVAQLGLDYNGNFTHYFNDGTYDFTNQRMKLGYTYQKSRRLYFDVQGTAGTYSNYLGAVPGLSQSVVTEPTLLFDNRTYFLQGSVGMTYLLSPRMSFTLGGDGFTTQYQSSALVGVVGYGARAKFQYRVTRLTSIGAEYDRQHFQYPTYFGNSDINNYNMFVATQMGRYWTFSLSAGAFHTSTVGLETVALDPAIAALLGVSTTVHTFSAANWLPSGQAILRRKFKNAELIFTYGRSAAPGNGVYLSSRTQNGGATFSYMGIQRVSLAIHGGYYSLASVGQGIAPYDTYTGGVRATYNFTHALHAVAAYDVREQAIQVADYRRTSFRATLGIAFSPGSLPLSLW